MQEYTFAEVKQHNKEEHGVWLIIDGLVYDVTKFKDHPGQFDILLMHSGTDVSKKFHSIHGKDVHALRDKFVIGKVVRSADEADANFEVPNQYVDADVPTYYYLLPVAVLCAILYFIVFARQPQA